MAALLYKPDMDEVRNRLTLWWNGGDIGRPVMLFRSNRGMPLEDIPVMPKPADWITDCSTSNFDYRVDLAARSCLHSVFHGEAVPCAAPDLAPNCLALYLGCKGREMRDTVWCEPCISVPDEARFEYDPGNFYWQFTRRLCREQLRVGRNKFLVHFPDLVEGLDTLAAMRGTEALLFDLTERPEWVRACLRQITERYFHYYDVLYDMIRDETGGSYFWSWAPGRMAKFQCDFSAMISPGMFGEYMVPVLTEMCERVSYCMYHWDGPGAIPHHDHLLAIPKLKMIQWTPGVGREPSAHRRWWPLYHKTVDAGKKLLISIEDRTGDFKALKKEFGPKLKQFMIHGWVAKGAEAEELIRMAQD